MAGIEAFIKRLQSFGMRENIDRFIADEKDKVLQNIDLTYGEHHLADHDWQSRQFEETDCVIDWEKEDLVLALHYQTCDYIEGCGYGNIFYDFYVVKRENQYYIKYVNQRGLCDAAEKIAKASVKKGVSWGVLYKIGFMSSEYKRYVKYEIMKETPPISEDEMTGILKKISKEAFPICTLDYLTCKRASTKVQVIDYYNGVHFITHKYIIPEYSMIVDLINYIFEKCKISCLKKCNLEFVDNMTEAKKLILFEEIENEYMFE